MQTKRALSRTAAVVLVLAAVTVPLEAKPPASSEAQAVAQIRAQVNATDAREKSYRKVERNIEGQSTEGGVLTGYYERDVLVKMTARYFGESGKATEEFYLRNSVPFFVLDTDYSYESLRSQKVVQIDQMRFYWNRDGKLVRVLDNKKRSVNLATPEVKRQAKDLMETVPKLIALLRAPANGVPDRR